jgi:hypothetical protein
MREGRSIRSFEPPVGGDSFESSPRLIGAGVIWPSLVLPSRIGRKPGLAAPPAPFGVLRKTIGASILRANLPRATALERVAAIGCSGFKSSFRTKANAASPLSSPLSLRRCSAISRLRGKGAFSASRETATRPLWNLRASIPLNPPGAW